MTNEACPEVWVLVSVMMTGNGLEKRVGPMTPVAARCHGVLLVEEVAIPIAMLWAVAPANDWPEMIGSNRWTVTRA